MIVRATITYSKDVPTAQSRHQRTCKRHRVIYPPSLRARRWGGGGVVTYVLQLQFQFSACSRHLIAAGSRCFHTMYTRSDEASGVYFGWRKEQTTPIRARTGQVQYSHKRVRSHDDLYDLRDR